MRIGHVFSAETEHLNKSIIKCIDDESLNSIYYLRNINDICGKDEALRLNEQWMLGVKRAKYGGFLQIPWPLRSLKTKGYLYIILKYLCTNFSLASWWRIIKGPRNLVIHGFAVNVSTLIILLLLGKRVIYLSWGGRPTFGRRTRFLDMWAYKLYHHIFVLMNPEIRYFTELVDKGNVSLLPYPISQRSLTGHFLYGYRPSRKVLLVGNSAWYIDEYCKILDKIAVGSWDKIICMLNYGNEKKIDEIVQFKEKYKAKFGDAFFPWTNTVSLPEYLKIVAEAPFYVCTAQTQTGLGIVRWCLTQGKAIFISGDNYNWFKNDMGMDVQDADSFADFNYSTLCGYVPTEDAYNVRLKRWILFCEKEHSMQGWRDKIQDAFR